MNLLAETRAILAESGKTEADVRWVGVLTPSRALRRVDRDPSLPLGTWADFERLADIDYHNGYGGNEIASGLVIVGDDWWLERGEYDGSEWWEFKTLPRPPAPATPLLATHLREE